MQKELSEAHRPQTTKKDPVRITGQVLVLSLLAAVGPMSIDMYLPGLPAIGRDLGVNNSAVQLTLSAFFVGFAVGQLIYGPLSDRYGRRPMLFIGLTFFTVMSALCAMAPTVESLTIFRLLQAFGGGAGTVITRGVIRDRYDMNQGAQVMSHLMFVVSFAPLMAPLVGGQILKWFGWRPIFWVLVAYGISSLLAVFFALPESNPPARRITRGLAETFRGYLRVLSDRRVLGCQLAGGLSFASMFAYISGTPFIYIEYFGIDPEYYGFLFGSNVVALMIGARLNSRLVMRIGVARLLMFGVILCALAGLVCLAVALTGLGGLPGLVIPLWFSVGSLPLIGGNAIALATEHHPSQAGAVAAIFGASQFGLGAVSGAAVGQFHNGTPVPMTAVIAVCGLASLLAAWIFLRER